MTNPRPTRDYFLVFCHETRQDAYRRALEGLPFEFRFVDDVSQLRMAALQQPPLAVVVDSFTEAHFRAPQLAAVFDLRMAWPVLRCSGPAADATVSSLDPLRCGPLHEALAALAAHDATWRSSRWRRTLVRIESREAVQLRVIGEDRWLEGTMENLALGGLFVVCFEPPQVGSPVELVFHLSDGQRTEVRGHVVWSRREAPRGELPGVGIALEADSLPEHFREAFETRARHAAAPEEVPPLPDLRLPDETASMPGLA